MVNRDEILKFYSPFAFIRSINDDKQVNLVKKSLEQFIKHDLDFNHSKLSFYYKKLGWDTDYFGKPIYKLANILSPNASYQILCDGIKEFLNQDFFEKNSLINIEIPSEDISLIQALGENGFKLIESRLTYVNDNLKKYDYRRFNAREAVQNDIETLMEVAKIMRNDFDKFHADQTFPQEKADEYLATYIKNSINGFTDYVMVPAEPSVPCEAFLTANYLKEDWQEIGQKASKMVLSAVNSSCKGWYVKLISEMTYHLRDNIGSDIIFMNTQSTNKAVIKTWESLGYKYGNCVHILSKNI
jgi:dTDP-4-amino-4,6-dideoxy-D-galactose acyltransferase